jgi:hypothetical protein
VNGFRKAWSRRKNWPKISLILSFNTGDLNIIQNDMVGIETGDLTEAVIASSGLALAGLLGGKHALNKFLK